MLWILLACTGTKDGDDSADSGAPVAAADAPVITDPSAECFLHTTGEEYWQWELSAAVTDPDGAETIARTGTVGATSSGDEALAEITIVRQGEALFGSFKEQDYDILCGDATTVRFAFTIADADGNLSQPVSTLGVKRADQ